MAELNELKEFEEATGDLEAIRGARGMANFDTEMTTQFKKFEDVLPTLKDAFGESKATLDDNGDIVLKKPDGEEINISKTKESLASGDPAGALEELKIPTDTEVAQQFIKEQKASFAETASGRMDSSIKTLNKEALNLEVPTDQESMDVIAKKANIDLSEPKKALEDIKNSGTDAKDPTVQQKVKNMIDKFGGELKQFLKNNWLSLLLITAIALAAKSLYDFIKRIQHAMNGCWATMNDNSAPCKINALTCDDDDLNNQGTGDGFKICDACQNQNCTVGGGDWIPMLKASAESCSPDKTNFPGCYNPLADTGATVCPTPFTERKCDGSTNFACPNAKGCVARKEACAGDNDKGDCSAWCDSSFIITRPGQMISCKKVSFWGAAGAAFGQIFKDLGLGGVLGTIEKWLLYIALGIVILVVVYIVIKQVIHSFTNSETIDIKVHDSGGGAKSAFGMRRKR